MGTEESSRRRGAHLGPSLRCAYLWLHRLPNQNLTFRDTWASVSRAYALDFNTASSVICPTMAASLWGNLQNPYLQNS